MANLLKKIEVGNPLINLEMWKLYEEHEKIKTNEELANFYHKLLDILEVYDMCNRRSPIFEQSIYNMIAYSTTRDVDPVYFLMQQTICNED